MSKKEHSMRDLMEQFKRIDSEMGGKNYTKDTIREDVLKYREVVEGHHSALISDKTIRESRSKWDRKFGFFQSLTESKFEVLSMDTDDFDMDLGNGEPVGFIEAPSVEAAQEQLGAFADRHGFAIETLFIKGLEEAEIDPAMDIPGEHIMDEEVVDEAPRKPKAPAAPQFVKLTDYEQTDKILHSNASVRIEYGEVEGHEVVVFVASASADADPYASDFDWQKAASATMFGSSEKGAKVVGIWYTDAKVGSMCMNSEIGDEGDYAAEDPFCPYY